MFRSDFTSYLVFMLFFTTLISILTLLCLESRLYIESLGFLALFVEALLGLPQFYNNWKRKSTVGMSVKMILMWTTGDVGKTIYFFVRHTPPQFWLCGLLQVGVDISILLQVTYYRSAGKRQHDRDALSWFDFFKTCKNFLFHALAYWFGKIFCNGTS